MLSVHNSHFYLDVMAEMRAHLAAGDFSEYRREFIARDVPTRKVLAGRRAALRRQRQETPDPRYRLCISRKAMDGPRSRERRFRPRLPGCARLRRRRHGYFFASPGAKEAGRFHLRDGRADLGADMSCTALRNSEEGSEVRPAAYR